MHHALFRMSSNMSLSESRDKSSELEHQSQSPFFRFTRAEEGKE